VAVTTHAVTASTEGPVDSDDRKAPPRSTRSRGRSALIAGVLVVLLVVPLAVALIVLRHPRWFPLLDMAQTEIRIRDIASTHPPLIGLAGRIGVYGPDGGSHPGPLSFYSLWPFYQLFGASTWALHAAAAMLNVVAVALAVWIAQRRGGLGCALAVATVLAVLMHGYGAALLTLAWNPYLPLLWWFVFLLAIWSLFVDDLAMLPVAVFAGFFCMQTHVSYVGLVSGLAVAAAVVITVRSVRRRREGAAQPGLLRWGCIGGALAVVLWVPPVVDQIVHSPGNLSTLWEYFTAPPDELLGYREGASLLLRQIDPWRLLTHPLAADIQPGDVRGSSIAGAVLLVCWAVAAVAAGWMRRHALVALHSVIALALILGLISTSRIFGPRFYYLVLWAWGLTALMLLAIGWTVLELARQWLDAPTVRQVERAGSIVLAGVLAVVLVAFVGDAARTDVQAPRQNESLGGIVEPTADALDRIRDDGFGGPFLVTWFPDGWTIGAQGYGLLNELLRKGFDVRAHMANRPGSTRFHVMEPKDATIEVHVATGRDIDRWRGDTSYDEVASIDPRSEQQRAEFERLRVEVMEQLRAAGLGELTEQVDENLFTLGIDQRVPDETKALVAEMLDIGMPTAVFIGPPSGGA
jgi:hypothetical protein